MTRIVVLLLAIGSWAQEPPTGPIAVKKDLLFSDDFEAAEPSKAWQKVVPTFVVENGTLKGTQTLDQDVPASEGVRAVKAHPAVHGLDLPVRDCVVELRVRFEGASMIDVQFTDRNYKGSHAGHICRVQVAPDRVTLLDERDGKMRNDIRELMKDPGKKDEVDRLLAGRRATHRRTLDAGAWHSLVVEIAGDEMRAVLDGTPAGTLKSSGIAHATKSRIDFGVAGKSARFDDLRIWSADPANP